MRLSGFILSTAFLVFSHILTMGQTSIVKPLVAHRIVNVFSGGLRATGFIWKHSNWVVTTLHAIGNSADIQLSYNGQGTHQATVIKVLKKADLVLLQSNDDISDEKFTSFEAGTPPVDTKLFTVGYYLDNQNYQDIDFEVGVLQNSFDPSANGNTLGDILDKHLQNQVRLLQYLDLTTGILYIKGHLLHGYSGSPIVDLHGNLVGIGDGGLENGAADISWCIRAGYLADLESSADQFPVNLPQLGIMFAADRERDLRVEVPDGSFSFKMPRSATFAHIDVSAQFSSTEDLGLQHMLTYINNLGVDYRNFDFDIYTEVHSGYTILVPKGYELTMNNDNLTVSDNSNGLAIVYHIGESNNIQQSFYDFENSLMPNFGTGQGPYWIYDPNWSYPTPIQGKFARVQRLTYVNGSTRQQFVQTISDKEKYFTATSAFAGHLISQAVSPPEQINLWIKFVLAAQLTTFSN